MATTVTLDVDAPRDPEYTNQVGDALYEAVRTLNHHTQSPAALRHASDVYHLLGNIRATVAALPQLYGQMGERLDQLETAGRLTEDDYARYDGDTGAAVVDLLNALARAADDADTMTAALEHAQQAAGGLRTEPS